MGFKEKFVAEVKEKFSRDIKDHVVRQLHSDGEENCRVWKCGRPQSSSYMFYVAALPNCLAVYGDMGECIWQRHYDMIPFIRGAIGSLDYFSEKVPQDIRNSIKEAKSELVDEWIATVKEDRISQGYEWGEKEDEWLAEVVEEYGRKDENPELFAQCVYETAGFDGDCESIPDVRFYTFHYLWHIEALKWFVAKLDADEVLPPVTPHPTKETFQ